jgi:preprotein translocase subunit SecG
MVRQKITSILGAFFFLLLLVVVVGWSFHSNIRGENVKEDDV